MMPSVSALAHCRAQRTSVSLSQHTSLNVASLSTLTPRASIYTGHIPTTQFEKLQLAVEALVTAAKDPSRLDMIAMFREVTGTVKLTWLQLIQRLVAI